MSPVFTAGPSWNVIFVSAHMRYSAAAPPPIVTVEPPRSAPKPLPQIVTQTPWFFCPPMWGPLSRSEKKMWGWAWAARDSGSMRKNISAKENFMKEYLNTPTAEPLGRDGCGQWLWAFFIFLKWECFSGFLQNYVANRRDKEHSQLTSPIQMRTLV